MVQRKQRETNGEILVHNKPEDVLDQLVAICLVASKATSTILGTCTNYQIRILQKARSRLYRSRFLRLNTQEGREVDYLGWFSIFSGRLRLRFDYLTTFFNDFRMASTTTSTTRLPDYFFQKKFRAARG